MQRYRKGLSTYSLSLYVEQDFSTKVHTQLNSTTQQRITDAGVWHL